MTRQTDAPDDVIEDYVRTFDERQLRYCHWKSNEHLEAGFTGETDLDVLFEEGDEAKVHAALTDLAYVRFNSVAHYSYPYVYDYLAVNPATGYLLHVHAHFRLIVGESGVKTFDLPWAAEYLDKARRDDASNFAIADPAEELLLLLLRAAIKKQFPKPLRRGRSSGVGSDDVLEFDWLKERTTRDDIKAVTELRLGDGSGASVLDLYDNGLSNARLLAFYEANRTVIESFRTVGATRALLRRWHRRLADLGYRGIVRTGLFLLPKHRVAPHRGVVVAIMGSDGAGKSTLLSSLKSRLSRKIDTRALYLGSGDGPSSALRYPLVMARRLFSRGDKGPGSESIVSKPKKAVSFPRRAFNAAWAITLAHEKRAKLRRADRARRKGMIVICDRYPQTTIKGFNDGPLLSEWASSGNALARAVSRWEHRIYSADHAPQPDLVLKLAADPELLLKRRPEMDLESIQLKQNGILATDFGERTRIVQIDASNTADDVLKTSLVEVFSAIRAANADDPKDA